MKLVRWSRFTWELKKVPPFENPLGEAYAFRIATRAEESIVDRVVGSSLSLDSDWADQFAHFRDRLRADIRRAFSRESSPAVVIQHGTRIVAASALTSEAEAETNLISGPCVLAEYRNRGLGTALLHSSLVHLAQAALERAHAITKDNATAMRFVYPKFGSTRVAHEFETSAAA
jgi:GNAT superfamily N-acetyltransferase